MPTMSEDPFERKTKGGALALTGLAMANPVMVFNGLITMFAVETNASRVHKAAVAEYETFVYDTLTGQQTRLDTLEQRVHRESWLVEEHERRLGEHGALLSDLTAILTAGLRVWQSTADAKKRKLLGNALRNAAFNPTQYEEGLTLLLLSILAEVTYGDIWVLRTLDEHVRTWPRAENTGALIMSPDGKPHPDGGVPLLVGSTPKRSLIATHVNRLREHGLVVTGHRNLALGNGISGNAAEINEPTELGIRLLKLTSEPGEPEPVPGP